MWTSGVMDGLVLHVDRHLPIRPLVELNNGLTARVRGGLVCIPCLTPPAAPPPAASAPAGRLRVLPQRRAQTEEERARLVASHEGELARRAEIRSSRAATRVVPTSCHRLWQDPENEADELAGGYDLEPDSGSGAGMDGDADDNTKRSHQDAVRSREQHWRRLDSIDIDTATMCSLELAAQFRDEQQALTNVVQQRINTYAANPKHPCSGTADFTAVEVVSWRPVELVSVMGTSIVMVPTLKCAACGAFEMSAAAARCTRSTPVYQTVWYHESLLGFASELHLPSAGVSSTSRHLSTAAWRRATSCRSSLQWWPTSTSRRSAMRCGTTATSSE